MSITTRPLRRVLTADAAVGLVAAAGMLLATTLYVQWTGLPATLLRGAAVVLLGYVIALSLAAALQPLRRGLVIGLIAANALWVIASIVVAIAVPAAPLGTAYVVGQALVVVGFGIAEYVLLRRVRD
jgi:hypothetical protein